MNTNVDNFLEKVVESDKIQVKQNRSDHKRHAKQAACVQQ